MTNITLSYLSLPDRSALHIALLSMPGPYSVEIRQNDPYGYVEWSDFIDADTVDDIYDFLMDEIGTCLPFALDIEQVTPAGEYDDDQRHIEQEATGLRA